MTNTGIAEKLELFFELCRLRFAHSFLPIDNLPLFLILFFARWFILRRHAVFPGGPFAQIDQLAALGTEGLEGVFRPPFDGLAAGGTGDGAVFLSHGLTK